jgi:hypothetical protein
MVVLASTAVLAFALLQAVPSASAPTPRAQSRQTGDAREITLALPHPLRKGETAWLLAEVGAIGHDQIQLTTQDGRTLGTISPFGVRSGQAAGTYTVPVPVEAFVDGQLALRLSVMHSGRATHAPTTEEVKSLRLLIRRLHP